MAIGSFVNGMVRGAGIRDTMDNNKRTRAMEDTRFEREGTRFEREGQQFEMDKERHDVAMERARRASQSSNRFSIWDAISRDMMENQGPGGGTGGEASPTPAQSNALSYPLGTPVEAAPAAAAPIEMSALSARPQQVASPQRFIYDPEQGLLPRGVA